MKQKIIDRIKRDRGLSAKLFVRLVGSFPSIGYTDDMKPYVTINGTRFGFSLESLQDALSNGGDLLLTELKQ